MHNKMKWLTLEHREAEVTHPGNGKLEWLTLAQNNMKWPTLGHNKTEVAHPGKMAQPGHNKLKWLTLGTDKLKRHPGI